MKKARTVGVLEPRALHVLALGVRVQVHHAAEVVPVLPVVPQNETLQTEQSVKNCKETRVYPCVPMKLRYN